MTVQEKGQAVVNPLNEFLTEQEVLDLLGLSRGQLDRLRNKGFPYCRINQNLRMYLVADIVDFIKSKRTVSVAGNNVVVEDDVEALSDDGESWKEPQED